MEIHTRKIAIIGAGHVGSHAGYALLSQGLAEEIVYIDIDEKKAGIKSKIDSLKNANKDLEHKIDTLNTEIAKCDFACLLLQWEKRCNFAGTSPG